MIVTVTLNPCIDLNLEVEEFSFTQPLRALDEKRRPGGKGINVSAVLDILGMPSIAVVPVGGSGGQEFKALAMEQVRFDLRTVPVKGNTRTNIVITARGDGRHLKVNQRGGRVESGDLERIHLMLADSLKLGDTLVLAGSLPPGIPADIYARWIAEFRGKGCFVALDADGEPLREGLRAHPHLIKPNREELERLAGRALDLETDLLGFAQGLIPEQCDICLVSNGSNPAYLLTSDFCLKGWPPEAHGSPVGAGDACLAGMIWGLMNASAKGKRGDTGAAEWITDSITNSTENNDSENYTHTNLVSLTRLDALKFSEPVLREAFRIALACGSAAASTADTEYFLLDLFHRCRDNTHVEAIGASHKSI